jgi:hypothetical protein
VLAATLQVKRAFGAPGDYGYTKQGMALAALYDLHNELAASALLAKYNAQEADAPLVERLADCLAGIVDTPLYSIGDPVGGYRTKMDVYLGGFSGAIRAGRPSA